MRCDVVVVGGGIPARACAQFLAEGGASVIGVGAVPADGLGAGFLGLAEAPWRLASSLGDEAAGSIFRFAQRGLNLAETRGWLRRTGGVWAAHDERELSEIHKSIKTLQRLNIPVVDDADPRAGLPGEGMTLPDEGCWLGWTETTPRIGPATAIVDTAHGIRVITPQQTIDAELVVFAGGPELIALDPMFAGALFFWREQALLRAGSLVMPGRTQHGWCQVSPSGGGVAVGGYRFLTPHFEEGETKPADVPKIQAGLEGFATSLGLPEPTVQRWAWIETKSCDGLPLLGPLSGRPRWVACTAFAGADISFGVAAAQAVANGILGASGEPIPASFRVSRLVA